MTISRPLVLIRNHLLYSTFNLKIELGLLHIDATNIVTHQLVILHAS
jgi:hypothetical protein